MCIEQRATRRGNLTHHALPVIARSTATWQSQSVIARLGHKPWQSIRSHFLSAGSKKCTREFVVALVYYILLSAGSKKCTREVVVALVYYIPPLSAGSKKCTRRYGRVWSRVTSALSTSSKKCTREVVVALVCYTPLFAGTVAYNVCGFKKVNPQTLYEVAWIQAIF